MARKFEISALEAAKIQIESSIDLLSRKSDFIGALTLAFAALGILKGWCERKKQPLKSIIFSEDFVKREKGTDWRKLMKKATNFFKHNTADKLIFYPETVQFYILDCCQVYRELTKDLSPTMMSFYLGIVKKYPDIFSA